MKILCVADHNDPLVYSMRIKKRFADIAFVLGCGDLRQSYFDFIISNLNKPLYFVFGNHHVRELDYYKNKNWQATVHYEGSRNVFRGVGATYIDSRCVKEGDLLLCGFGGSRRYNNGRNQFSEFGMFRKILRTLPGLLCNRLFYGRYVDIVITHAPPLDIHDQKDRCHRGFKCFRWFMRRFKPRYLIHGHVHLYSKTKHRIDKYHETLVVNAYDHFVLEIEDAHGG